MKMPVWERKNYIDLFLKEVEAQNKEIEKQNKKRG
jgi:hypothetical protein